MKLSPECEGILTAMAAGAMLKSHRDIEGGKVYRLHRLVGPEEEVGATAVDFLRKSGLIRSNMKFPVATYLLTDKGRAVSR